MRWGPPNPPNGKQAKQLQFAWIIIKGNIVLISSRVTSKSICDKVYACVQHRIPIITTKLTGETKWALKWRMLQIRLEVTGPIT